MPDPYTPDLKEKRDLGPKLIAAIVVLLSVAVGVEFTISNRRSRSEPMQPLFDTRAASPEPPRLAPVENQESSLAHISAPGANGPSFEEFFAAMEEQVQNSAEAKAGADEFKKEFDKEPALKKIYEEFKEAVNDGEERTANEFVTALNKRPEFAKLLVRFGSNPSAQASYAAFAADPKIAPVLQKAFELAKAAPAPGPKQGATVAVSSPGTRKPSAGSKGVVSFAGAAAAAGAPPPTGAQVIYGGASLSASGVTTGEAAVFTAGTRSAPPGGPGASSGGVNPKLDQSWRTGDTSEQMRRLLQVYPCLSTLGEPVVQSMISSSDIDNYGLWGACFARKLYGACKRAGCLGQPQDGWSSCKDWKGAGPGTDAVCRTECLAQAPDCELPRMPEVTRFVIPSGPAPIAWNFRTANADRTEAGVCKISGPCTNSSLPCPSFTPPPWSGPTEFDDVYEVGTDGGGCCFLYRLRACKGALCSAYSEVTACFD